MLANGYNSLIKWNLSVIAPVAISFSTNQLQMFMEYIRESNEMPTLILIWYFYACLFLSAHDILNFRKVATLRQHTFLLLLHLLYLYLFNEVYK